MIKSHMVKTVSVMALGFLTAQAATAQSAADIPVALNGTYELTHAFSTGKTPYPYADGDVLTFVINGTNDTMCVDGKLLESPFVRTGGVEMMFEDTATSVFYAPSVRTDGSFNEINLYTPTNAAGDWAGQFVGSKTSDSLDCAGSSSSGGSTLSLSTEAQNIFTLAEELYPTLFVNGSALAEYQGYVYKYFAASKIYVGIKDGKLFLKGGPYGSQIKPQGTLSTVFSYLQEVKQIRIANAANNSGGSTGGGNASDLFDLTISGTYNLAGIGITIPSITIEDITAIDPTDDQTIVEYASQIGASEVTNIEVVVLNNTANRVTFTIEFDGKIGGQSVMFDLTYDFVR